MATKMMKDAVKYAEEKKKNNPKAYNSAKFPVETNKNKFAKKKK